MCYTKTQPTESNLTNNVDVCLQNTVSKSPNNDSPTPFACSFVDDKRCCGEDEYPGAERVQSKIS